MVIQTERKLGQSNLVLVLGTQDAEFANRTELMNA